MTSKKQAPHRDAEPRVQFGQSILLVSSAP